MVNGQWNPFDLSKHLADDHGLSETTVDMCDSDELRQVHKGLHSLGTADHFHAD